MLGELFICYFLRCDGEEGVFVVVVHVTGMCVACDNVWVSHCHGVPLTSLLIF